MSKFQTGRLILEPEISETVPELDWKLPLKLHRNGNWGIADHQTKKSNDEGINKYEVLISVWLDSKGEEFWIVTEGDHLTTTIQRHPWSTPQ